MTEINSERLRLIKIVNAGILQLSVVAAEVCIRDRIAKRGPGRVQEEEEFDALARSIAAPYVKALAELALIEAAGDGCKDPKKEKST